jgi:hypothetical protein
VPKRCSRCWSRKCDSGPGCANNRKPRSRTAEYKRAWRQEKAKRAGRVCRKGHAITRPVQNCPVCTNEREKRRKRETRAALAPKSKPKAEPVYFAEVGPFALSADELAKERAEWKRREAERFERALQKARAADAAYALLTTAKTGTDRGRFAAKPKQEAAA